MRVEHTVRNIKVDIHTVREKNRSKHRTLWNPVSHLLLIVVPSLPVSCSRAATLSLVLLELGDWIFLYDYITQDLKT